MSMRDREPADEGKDAQFVASYLQDHPEFFKQYPDVLEKLQLPHRSGSAISLVEKQQAVLRERNTALRGRLSTLLEASKNNDSLFDKTRLLVLGLIKAHTREDVFKALHNSLKEDFGIEYFNLILLDCQAEGPGVRVETRNTVDDALSIVSNASQPTCGVLRPREMQVLFGETGRAVGSAAAIRLGSDEPYGILALGSSDPHRYHSSMDTLFLRFIADVLDLVLTPKLS